MHANHKSASIVQDASGNSDNIDIKKALETISKSRISSTIDKKDLYHALFLAGSLFGRRLAANRYMVIISCGNCIDYDMLATVKISKLLKARNIIVSSWGSYTMVDRENSLENENCVGYGYEKVFLNKAKTTDIDVDSLSGYRIEHNQDLCSRLAAKTSGAVFDINQLKSSKIFEATVTKLREVRPSFENKIEKCERISTPYGDVADFKFRRIQSQPDEDDNDN